MSRLEQVDGDLWVAEGEIVSFYGFPYPTRAAIARLADGRLWVWSPVRLNSELRAEVDHLGSVAHLVSPNKLHHLYLAEWKAANPQATLWGPEIHRGTSPGPRVRRTPEGFATRGMGARLRSGVVPRIVRNGRGRVLSSPVARRAGRRSDPGLRRPIPASELVVVAPAVGPPRRNRRQQSRRAARVAPVLHRPGCGSRRAGQSAELGLRASNPRPWRMAAVRRTGFLEARIRLARGLSSIAVRGHWSDRHSWRVEARRFSQVIIPRSIDRKSSLKVKISPLFLDLFGTRADILQRRNALILDRSIAG